MCKGGQSMGGSGGGYINPLKTLSQLEQEKQDRLNQEIFEANFLKSR